MVRRIDVGINTDPMNRQLGDGNPQPQEIKDLAAGWVRFTLKDPNEGPQPTTLGNYDQLVDNLHNAGIKILMILSYETYPNWPRYTPGVEHPQEWAVYTDRFAARCRQIASHYGAKVQAYEIWNEPDHQEGDYNPKVDAKFFGPLLKAAYTKIKDVSNATVVMGGVASGQPPYVTQVMNATNGVLFADALGVHPYAQRPEADWPSPSWGGGVMTDQIRTYHNLARKPIWITEVGINPALDNIAFQAQFLKRTFKALNAQEMAQIAPCVFWYCWSHAMGQTFGLIGAAGEKRQSYDEFRAFAVQSGPAARLRSELLARAEQEQRIQFNPQAALQASIFADGFAPNSGEFSVPFGNVQYRAQRAEHLRTGEVRAYYAQVPLWYDVQFVTRPGAGEAGPAVTDRLSAHSSGRNGDKARYIIVHSTASAVGAPAEDALTLLVGPNPGQISVHEVVLPADQVFRLVPDDRAAHHLMSQNVQLPDGTS
ncbi:MAG: cellulase family glycosylhydrolase, partial [Anaerolineales bacterium]